MHLLGTHILYGFLFSHDFEDQGVLEGSKYTITQWKIRYRHKSSVEKDNRTLKLYQKIPLIIVEDRVDERNILAVGRLEGKSPSDPEDEEEEDTVHSLVCINSGRGRKRELPRWALGFEVAYFGAHSEFNLPEFYERLKNLDATPLLHSVLQEMCMDCGLPSFPLDFISVPRHVKTPW